MKERIHRRYDQWVDLCGIEWPEPGEGIPGYHRVAEDAFKAGWDARQVEVNRLLREIARLDRESARHDH